ncbi:MAG: DUF11 domain-containing protein [Planctomycetaceae bacterium]|jgi:uncharacterized repeat protein (TIGR01451 family)|nr:DUF11 domain-containing protein [Planctomycetaceae bacterium]
MERYLTKLIMVNFVAGIFVLFFGFILNPLIYAQRPKPLPLPISASVLSKDKAVSASASASSIVPVSSVSVERGTMGELDVLGQKEVKKPGLLERIRKTILGSDYEEDENSDSGHNENLERPANINKIRPIAPPQPITPPKPTTVQLKEIQPDAPMVKESQLIGTSMGGMNLSRSNSSTRVAQSNEVYGYSDSNAEKSSLERLNSMRNAIFDQNYDDSDESYLVNSIGGNMQRSIVESPNSYDDWQYDSNNSKTNRSGRSDYTNYRENSRENYRENYHENYRENYRENLRHEQRLQNSTPFDRGNSAGYEHSNGQVQNQANLLNRPYYETTRLHQANDKEQGGVASTSSKNWNDPAVPSYQPVITSSQGGVESRQVSGGTVMTNSNNAKRLTVSPLIEVETEGDSRVIVGRESKYRIRVRNRGGATAEQVMLTIEIPNWITFRLSELSSGASELKKENKKSNSRDLIWNIGQIEPNCEELLELLLIPQERKTIDLKILYDFRKPSTTTTIVVEEATLEMELQGPDQILWGTETTFTLWIRNIGSGDAEKVKLELLETGSAMKELTFPVIKAGEEKAILVDVWAGKQQNSVDINIQATGAYDVNAKLTKKVKILRPEVTMVVETAETQFVGSPAEFIVKIKNTGSADAKNLDLTVTIPIGAKYISSTNGGILTPQNHVKWTIDSLPVNSEFTSSIICTPNREGICKIDTVLKDKEDSVAQCTSVFTAEALADLRMFVESPNGPIEVGQDTVWVINVTNRGTKMASNVGLFVYCSEGLRPISTNSDKSKIENGVVEFDLIPTISAGQTLTMKVVIKAERGGTHQIRTELLSPYNADVAAGKVEPQTKLSSEQTLNFYQRRGSIVSPARQTQTSNSTLAETPLLPQVKASETVTEPEIIDPFPK